MGVIHAPILNFRTGSPESVFSCLACRGYKESRHVLTDESFQDHIRKYGEIEEGKHVRIERVDRNEYVKYLYEDGKVIIMYNETYYDDDDG